MKNVKSKLKDFFVILLITVFAAAMGTIKVQDDWANKTEYNQMMVADGPSAWQLFKAVVIYAWESTRPDNNPCDDNPKLCAGAGGTER